VISYILRRLAAIIPLFFFISLVAFIIIQLPPGSFLDNHILTLKQQGVELAEEEIARLTRRYDLDKPLHVQYLKWIKNIVFHGDLGRSFQYAKPAKEILAERVPRTMLISLLTAVFAWVVAMPIAIYSATHQYSKFDYLFTFLGFIGLALPNFLLALVLMWVFYILTGHAVTGLYSVEFIGAPMSWAKLFDFIKNIWLPLVVIGTAGTAGLIRVMRGTLLDELGKHYVVTARAKGLQETRLLFKYPVRVAINPVMSTIGWMLPAIVSGETIVAIVLNLQTVGPVLLNAIQAQDMYLAGSIIMILSSLTMVGTLVSDILLVWLDPRIRYEKQAKR
jgi:peptide/nickel transport system permease protein